MIDRVVILSVAVIFIILIIILILSWIYYQKTIRSTYVPQTENFLYSSSLSSKSQSPPSPFILTYNIQKFPWSPKTFSTLRTICKQYSIILLQECYDETFSALEINFPEYYICRGTLQGINLINSGLVILSKYPIKKSLFLPYKQCNPLTFDRFAEKGFLIAWISIGDKTIQVINTHLQSSDYDKCDPYAFVQIDELFEYVEYVGGSFFIGGDFNIDITYMKKRYMPSVQNLNIYHPLSPTIYIDFKTGHSQYNKKLGYEGLIFDYFFTSKDICLEKTKTIESPYSDHNCVETNIIL